MCYAGDGSRPFYSRKRMRTTEYIKRHGDAVSASLPSMSDDVYIAALRYAADEDGYVSVKKVQEFM